MKNTLFFIKKIIHCGDGNGVGMHEPVEDEYE